jgi:hypothetical protein
VRSISIEKLVYCRVLTRDGLGAAGVGDAYESLDEDAVLVVVPISEDDGELAIVSMYFAGRMEDERCAETVDVLTL